MHWIRIRIIKVIVNLLQVFKHWSPLEHLPWAPDGPPQGWSSDFAHVKQHPHSSFVYWPLSQQCGGGGHWKFGIRWHRHASTDDCWLNDVKYTTKVRKIKPKFARTERREDFLVEVDCLCCRCENTRLCFCFLGGWLIFCILLLSFNEKHAFLFCNGIDEFVEVSSIFVLWSTNSLEFVMLGGLICTVSIAFVYCCFLMTLITNMSTLNYSLLLCSNH